MNTPIQLRFLDHVAIKVADLERSAQWYEKVHNLKRYSLAEWGPFPIFMLSGKTGVAIFPADTQDNKQASIRIDHFAFNVDQQNFNLARKHYEALGIEYVFQDHHYFHSVYTKDPDGHTVELTTIVVDEENFY